MSAKPRRDSSKCAIVNRTVSFNIENEWEAQLERMVSDWTNFSGTVKRLIAATLQSQPSEVPVIHTQQINTREAVPELPVDDYDPVADLFGT